ncbi:deoxyribodipyrimidine photo-lyase [Conexibacter sp. SYSU D00693]|uniref:cryptochrome/photolyase family protein n=1 Tax=Conexibacter sp. SYSU D00693 TaxID=2812560 RepID=UPI00196A67D7|nr:deoxyribodipyrimidine photo-lyase [Conexibacter sp. SYSU D00693]
MSDARTIVWLRRDLRVHDHPALAEAAAAGTAVPVFVLDDALLRGRCASAARTAWMLDCLRVLDEELRERGSALVVRHGPPERVLVELAREAQAAAVAWTSDVSPYARARDARVTEALRGAGVEARPRPGTYVTDPNRLRAPDGGPFGVFARFERLHREAPRRDVLPAPEHLAPLPDGLDPGRVPQVGELGDLPGPLVPEPIREPGERAARAALDDWVADGLAHYAERRPAQPGDQRGMARVQVSVLSPYLRWGCLSARECEARALDAGGTGATAWRRQLAWRDFHAHVLLLRPGNAHHEHREELRGTLEFDHDADRLAAWQEGRTGFPLVDAGMRQLRATGWMHNRVRLVAGSFLTKDLHLDWRLGEQWFARLLLDGEPAQNNGNWQWIAGTGVDPQPAYRRIYNPARQRAAFDPAGAYVRHWVPELRDVPDDALDEPGTLAPGYPLPIVDHLAERREALRRYGEARERGAAAG